MHHTPDRLLGFKYLHIHYNGQPYSLRSHIYFWDARGVIFAECDKYTKKKFAHPSRDTPNEKCVCGIYGGFDVSVVREFDYWDCALFLVEGFGKSIVYENGFRSESARIVCIVDSPYSWFKKYDEIAVSPRLPRISLEVAAKTLREHRVQWLNADLR